jgi:hypothetical protein
MVKSKPIIVLSAITIGIIVFFFIINSEERQVKKRFNSLAQTASISVGESPLIIASKCKKVSKYFAPNCDIEAPEYNVSRSYSQNDIHTIAVHVLSRYSELKLSFIDLQVEIPEKGMTHVVSTVRIIGKIKREETTIEEYHEIDSQLKKIENEWVFVRMELIDVLNK